MVAILISMAGCTTAPFGERTRIIDVPLAAAQSDIEFSITSGSRADLLCSEDSACASEAEGGGLRLFVLDVERIARALQKEALLRYPDLAWCSPRTDGGCFDVYIVEGDAPGSSSSANGRIALSAGLGQWRSHEGVLAFVIAREMGHVVARHHKERSSISIVTSVLLNLLLPGSGLLKSLISTGGGRLMAVSNRDTQAKEADAIAFNLLKGAGFRLRDVSKSLLAMSGAVDETLWARDFGRSSNRLVAAAADLAAESTVASVANGKGKGRRDLSANLAQ
ncbi:MAG: M48 family metalloprotease [Dechloromonas sp.]|nr:M48 family metalloprotease [Dechloromonas sp.]